MSSFDSRENGQIVIVGRYRDDFVRYVKDFCRLNGFAAVYHENAYSAVCHLSRTDKKVVAVVGRFEQLSIENGRFFEKANEGIFVCCCLITENTTGISRNILSAIEKGVLVINEPMHIEAILKRLVEKPVQSLFDENKFRISQAERDALLGV